MPKKEEVNASEKSLAKFWRRKTKSNQSDFDEMLEYSERFTVKVDAKDKRTIAQLICDGYPLSRAEYYVALALGFLTTDLTYETFYLTRWHETKTHRGYGSQDECELCEQERADKKSSGGNNVARRPHAAGGSRRRAVHR